MKVVFSMLIAALLLGSVVYGQTPEAAACTEGRIVEVRVVTRKVFEDGSDGLAGALYDVGNVIHSVTRESVLRRELLFAEGDCLDRFRLIESERLLRELSFIKTARIEAVERADGDFDVLVDTQDDWTLRLEPAIAFGEEVSFTGIRFGERSLLGTGRRIDLFLELGTDTTGYSVTYSTPQTFRSRWDFELRAGRLEPGRFAAGRLSYPFLGLVGHRAAFVEGGYTEARFNYFTGDARERHELIQPFTRQAAQLGAALRRSGPARGRATRLGTFGASLSLETLDYDERFFPDSAAALGPSDPQLDSLDSRLLTRDALRLNVLLGVQALEFTRYRGLTTLDAVEDVALGPSANLIAGYAPGILGADDRHALFAIDGYYGTALGSSWLTLIRGSFESRRDFDARVWRDIFAAVDIQNLWQPAKNHTLLFAGRFGAGWEASIPFQLTLGGDGRVRGYPSHRWPGGARMVFTVEDRARLTSLAQLLEIGTTLAVDVGRMWSNGVDFGTSSGWRAGWVAGLRFATPVGSRTTYRLELRGPISSDAARDIIFFFAFELTRPLERRPTDIQLDRSRDAALFSTFGSLQ